MNIVFFGSSEFAVSSLEALADSPHKILTVVTQPDRKAGRRLELTQTPVKIAATGLKLPIYQPESISSADAVRKLSDLKADLFIVAAFGQILPLSILEIPRLYAINLHASLLPKYRGAAPVNRAIINGEKISGVTVIKMNEYMDKGDIILQREVKVSDKDTALRLDGKLAGEGAKLILETLDLIEQGNVSFIRQKEEEATYAPKLEKKDGLINWNMPAGDICNHIRGMLPWPGSFTHFKGMVLKIWEAEVLSGDAGGDAGKVVRLDKKAGIIEIATKKDNLAIKSLQFEGGKKLSAKEFLAGHSVSAGDVLC